MGTVFLWNLGPQHWLESAADNYIANLKRFIIIEFLLANRKRVAQING
jgi:hypothetical protein